MGLIVKGVITCEVAYEECEISEDYSLMQIEKSSLDVNVKSCLPVMMKSKGKQPRRVMVLVDYLRYQQAMTYSEKAR